MKPSNSFKKESSVGKWSKFTRKSYQFILILQNMIYHSVAFDVPSTSFHFGSFYRRVIFGPVHSPSENLRGRYGVVVCALDLTSKVKVGGLKPGPYHRQKALLHIISLHAGV